MPKRRLRTRTTSISWAIPMKWPLGWTWPELISTWAMQRVPGPVWKRGWRKAMPSSASRPKPGRHACDIMIDQAGATIAASQRVALALECRGAGYQGWQAQYRPGTPTVQETLEQALGRIAAAPVRVQCAGRTDRVVHASHQLVHFDSPVARPVRAWVQGANSLLPDTVVVKWARPVDATFHARFSARARRYRYVIFNRPVRSPHLAALSAHFPWPLDEVRMEREAQALLGERDFSAYRGT